MAALLWALVVLFAILWFAGFVLMHVTGPLIHLLLIVALIMIVWNLFAGRNQAV